MNTKARIESILNANLLDTSITGLPTFRLSELQLNGNQKSELDFPLPANRRLGHLAERVVSELIKRSSNYNVLYENIQLIEIKRTIGEIDFLIEDVSTKQVMHLELAYKFYLFDPEISTNTFNNWIGPNRNDSLREKLGKLKRKQLPLLYHECAAVKLSSISIEEATQAICLLVSLFIPYKYEQDLDPEYKNAIKGYYIDLEAFCSLDNSIKSYHLPQKTEWGMDPSNNETWSDFNGIEKSIGTSIKQRQSTLCWLREGDVYSEIFIVWW